ncbi:MAG: hypothetical protein JXM70_25630 [Pirellulales bacterium]|nr:hypothetical protein [Pirellulales bacterium]
MQQIIVAIMLLPLSISITYAAEPSITASKPADIPKYSKPNCMVDGKPDTMYAVDDVNNIDVSITYETPVPVRWLIITQAGWKNSPVWGQLKSFRLTINDQPPKIVYLLERPAEPQSIDLETIHKIKSLRISGLERFEHREHKFGGLAEISLAAERPENSIVADQQSSIFVHHPGVNAPNLHTTAAVLSIKFMQIPTDSTAVDFRCMDKSVWRAMLQPNGRSEIKTTLSPKDFKCVTPGQPPTGAIQFYCLQKIEFPVKWVERTSRVEAVDVQWLDENKTVYPWEFDPKPVATIGGRAYWPGAHRNNAGHFAFRYEPNGLLINNASFDRIERSWYYFKPGRRGESFQFNYGIPGAVKPAQEMIVRGELKTNLAGVDRQYEYKQGKGNYTRDEIKADWTSMRWTRRIKTAGGKTYRQQLRYSTLAVGVQVETDAPSFEMSFQDAKATNGPRAIVMPNNGGISVVKSVDPRIMSTNWLLLLAGDGTPEIPVMLVFQCRPQKIEIQKDGLTVHNTGGVGTIAIGTPFGATTLPADTCKSWQDSPSKIPVDSLRRFADLLAAYPFRCTETFTVADGTVHIKDLIEFLPWCDDWKTEPVAYSPLPPLVSYSVQNGYLPKNSISDTIDLQIPTKWGPYLVMKGNEVQYRLPVPKSWDNFPLHVRPDKSLDWLYGNLQRSLSSEQLRSAFGHAMTDEFVPAPSEHPHAAAHDFAAGAWRAANYMSAENREFLRNATRRRVISALLPQNYRLRTDPLTGAQYVACTVWCGESEYTVNGENFADIDYWQGLTIYGIYTHAKYAAMWDTMRRHWPVIRSMLSYWEATHSWALMSPGAREAGEMYHGDMPHAGYAGLVGFYRLAQHLGSPYEKDMGAYLLAKAAVPTVAKYGFGRHAVKLPHQELGGWVRPCTGFAERWVAAFPFTDPGCKNFEPKDPWWRTGCIGPQSGQVETTDLIVRRCRDDLLWWEKDFIKACPDNRLVEHDSVRVLPHVMLRNELADTLRISALEVLKNYQSMYLLRDAHIPAMILSNNCPIRLLDWAPAYIKSADFNEHHVAVVGVTNHNKATKLTIAISQPVTIKHNEQTVAARQVDNSDGWKVLSVDIPQGEHTFTICPSKTP